MLKKINPIIILLGCTISAFIFLIIGIELVSKGFDDIISERLAITDAKIKASKDTPESKQIKVQSIEPIVDEYKRNLYLLRTEEGVFRSIPDKNLKLSDANTVFVRYPLPNEDGKLPEAALKFNASAICVEQDSNTQCFPGLKMVDMQKNR